MADEKSKQKPADSEPPVADLTHLAEEDFTQEDMADIKRLLEQKRDLTRQDMTAQDFQSLLSRYLKE